MRLLINNSAEDKPFLLNLIPILKQHGHTGAATAKAFDITSLQQMAQRAGVDAILLSNPETLKALVGETATLEKYRGSRLNYPIPVLVVNPFAHIHTIDYGKWLLNSDLRKLKRIRESVQSFSFETVDTEEKRATALHFLAGCIVNSYDIETNDPIIRDGSVIDAADITCISFTGLHKTGHIKTFVVPFIDFGQIHYTTEAELEQAVLFMRTVLAMPITKTAWNGSYDAQYCIRYHAWPNNWTMDGMILAWSEYSELPRAIEFQASIHCHDYIYWKDQSEQAKKAKDIMSYWGYCGLDSWYSLRILISLLANLKEHQIHNYRRIFRQVYPDLYCAFEGILIDTHKREMVKIEAEARRTQYLSELKTMSCNDTFNPGSWQQVSHFLYQVIGAKKPEKTKGAGTDVKVLNRISMQHPLIARICDLITKYREEAKAISTYYSCTLYNNRVLYNMDSSGAETGRKACRASSFWCGSQIQNQPSYAKVYMMADEGYTLIERDNNKSEARCVAYLSQSEKLIAALEDLEHDFYLTCSSLFFGIPYEQITLEMRNDITKHVIHGIHYLMGPEPLIDRVTPKKMYDAMTLTKSKIRDLKTFAKYLLSLYHNPFPELRKNLWESVKEEIRATGQLVSPLGWTRKFFADIDKHHAAFRAAVAHAPQNLSVDIVNEDYYRAYREIVIPSNGEFRIKAQIHDSIFAQALTSKVMEYAQRLNDIKPGVIKVHGKAMLLPTDTKVGKVWASMEKIKLA